jgi:nudix-type nucleoside diphosphatase (YffH/AdpP family)
MSIEIANIETKYGGWTRLLVAEVRLPDGHMIRREIEDHGAAVAVLAYDPERKTAILVQQFRAPVFYRSRQERTLEVIAGIQEETDATSTARREALEEAGLELRSLEYVATTWTMPGISTERMSLYFATCRRSDGFKQRGGIASEHEDISVVELELGELDRMMQAGEITDMKTLVLVQALRLQHAELFA